MSSFDSMIYSSKKSHISSLSLRNFVAYQKSKAIQSKLKLVLDGYKNTSQMITETANSSIFTSGIILIC